MTRFGDLWAIGYDDMERAEPLRAALAMLGQSHCLNLLDTAVVVRYGDGSVTLDGEPFVSAANLRGHSFASFLARLTLARRR